MNEIADFFNRRKTLRPFEPVLIEFCESLSQALFDYPKIRTYPDIVALAFWLRKGHLEDLRAAFLQEQGNEFLTPRGIVFHIAPANVETMFVYSWILALLTGNANIVRLPTKDNENLKILFDVIRKILKEPHFKQILDSTLLLSYGHDEAMTAALSAHADMRILWGGDETIRTLRRIPIPPFAKEIVFPDRFAFAAFYSEAFLSATEDEKQNVIKNLYNDIYWYDQLACSSPKVCVWVGTKEQDAEASAEVYNKLQKLVREKRYTLSLGLALQKETYLYSMALELPHMDVQRFSNELTVVKLNQFDDKCRQHCGSGLLYHLEVENLSHLGEMIGAQDQTLVYYGFEKQILYKFARELNGKGLVNIVPVGQALNFDYLWDGYNLLAELTKCIQIK